MDLRMRLRNMSGGTEFEGEGEEEVSSLDLPIDRSNHIITVEQYILQLTETRSELRKFWKLYRRGLRNLKTLDEFEGRYKKVSASF